MPTALQVDAGPQWLRDLRRSARDRYDMDYNWDFGNDKFTLEDPHNRQREIGPAQEIPTHRWTTNFLYQLPFGKGRKFGSNF